MLGNSFHRNRTTSRQIHKSYIQIDGGEPCQYQYKVVIPHTPQLIGLGDGLSNIMMNYSDYAMFGQPTDTDTVQYSQDLRPQIVLANFSNHNNILPVINDYETRDECSEGRLLRRNINLQRLHRHQVFIHFNQQIRDELIISIFSYRYMACQPDLINQNLFMYLPQELVDMIVKLLTSKYLFNSSGI